MMTNTDFQDPTHLGLNSQLYRFCVASENPVPVYLNTRQNQQALPCLTLGMSVTLPKAGEYNTQRAFLPILRTMGF